MTNLTRRQVLTGAATATAAALTNLDAYEAAAAEEKAYELSENGYENLLKTFSNPAGGLNQETGIARIKKGAGIAFGRTILSKEIGMAESVLQQLANPSKEEARQDIIATITKIGDNNRKLTLPILEEIIISIRNAGIDIPEEELNAGIDNLINLQDKFKSFGFKKIPFTAQELKGTVSKAASLSR